MIPQTGIARDGQKSLETDVRLPEHLLARLPEHLLIRSPAHVLETWTRLPLLQRSGKYSGVGASLNAIAISVLVYNFIFTESSPLVATASTTTIIDTQTVTPVPLEGRLAPTVAQRIPTKINAEREVQIASLWPTVVSGSVSNDNKTEMTGLQLEPNLESKMTETKTNEGKSSDVPHVNSRSEELHRRDESTSATVPGDVTAAQPLSDLLFNRAANGGNVAVAVAATTKSDPRIPRNGSASGVIGDLEEAATWYDWVSKPGSGRRRVEMVATGSRAKGFAGKNRSKSPTVATQGSDALAASPAMAHYAPAYTGPSYQYFAPSIWYPSYQSYAPSNGY
jgi:hypothetical protein